MSRFSGVLGLSTVGKVCAGAGLGYFVTVGAQQYLTSESPDNASPQIQEQREEKQKKFEFEVQQRSNELTKREQAVKMSEEALAKRESELKEQLSVLQWRLAKNDVPSGGDAAAVQTVKKEVQNVVKPTPVKVEKPDPVVPVPSTDYVIPRRPAVFDSGSVSLAPKVPTTDNPQLLYFRDPSFATDGGRYDPAIPRDILRPFVDVSKRRRFANLKPQCVASLEITKEGWWLETPDGPLGGRGSRVVSVPERSAFEITSAAASALKTDGKDDATTGTLHGHDPKPPFGGRSSVPRAERDAFDNEKKELAEREKALRVAQEAFEQEKTKKEKELSDKEQALKDREAVLNVAAPRSKTPNLVQSNGEVEIEGGDTGVKQPFKDLRPIHMQKLPIEVPKKEPVVQKTVDFKVDPKQKPENEIYHTDELNIYGYKKPENEWQKLDEIEMLGLEKPKNEISNEVDFAMSSEPVKKVISNSPEQFEILSQPKRFLEKELSAQNIENWGVNPKQKQPNKVQQVEELLVEGKIPQKTYGLYSAENLAIIPLKPHREDKGIATERNDNFSVANNNFKIIGKKQPFKDLQVKAHSVCVRGRERAPLGEKLESSFTISSRGAPKKELSVQTENEKQSNFVEEFAILGDEKPENEWQKVDEIEMLGFEKPKNEISSGVVEVEVLSQPKARAVSSDNRFLIKGVKKEKLEFGMETSGLMIAATKPKATNKDGSVENLKVENGNFSLKAEKKAEKVDAERQVEAEKTDPTATDGFKTPLKEESSNTNGGKKEDKKKKKQQSKKPKKGVMGYVCTGFSVVPCYSEVCDKNEKSEESEKEEEIIRKAKDVSKFTLGKKTTDLKNAIGKVEISQKQKKPSLNIQKGEELTFQLDQSIVDRNREELKKQEEFQRKCLDLERSKEAEKWLGDICYDLWEETKKELEGKKVELKDKNTMIEQLEKRLNDQNFGSSSDQTGKNDVKKTGKKNLEQKLSSEMRTRIDNFRDAIDKANRNPAVLKQLKEKLDKQPDLKKCVGEELEKEIKDVQEAKQQEEEEIKKEKQKKQEEKEDSKKRKDAEALKALRKTLTDLLSHGEKRLKSLTDEFEKRKNFQDKTKEFYDGIDKKDLDSYDHKKSEKLLDETADQNRNEILQEIANVVFSFQQSFDDVFVRMALALKPTEISEKALKDCIKNRIGEAVKVEVNRKMKGREEDYEEAIEKLGYKLNTARGNKNLRAFKEDKKKHMKTSSMLTGQESASKKDKILMPFGTPLKSGGSRGRYGQNDGYTIDVDTSNRRSASRSKITQNCSKFNAFKLGSDDSDTESSFKDQQDKFAETNFNSIEEDVKETEGEPHKDNKKYRLLDIQRVGTQMLEYIDAYCSTNDMMVNSDLDWYIGVLRVKTKDVLSRIQQSTPMSVTEPQRVEEDKKRSTNLNVVNKTKDNKKSLKIEKKQKKNKLKFAEHQASDKHDGGAKNKDIQIHNRKLDVQKDIKRKKEKDRK